MKKTRQDFLKSSAVLGAAAGFPTIIPSSVLGQNGQVAPSNRAAIGIIGCGNRSASCGEYTQSDNAEIVAVCDPFLDRRLKRTEAWGVKDHYTDFRDLLARKDIDAVHIVTPDHWHVSIALAAARAGKDIYCEKPLGISIEQDLAARTITAKYNRIFQYGTQQRSMQHLRMGIELVLNGHIGEVKEVFVWAPGGATGGSTETAPVPENFAYDLWLGPAPVVPYTKDRCTNRGAWFIYDYAIGFIAGWGAHPIDQLQWWADMSGRGIPVEYRTTGTIPKEGLFDTVTRWDMEAVYADGMKLWFTDVQTAFEKQKAPGMEQLTKFKNCTQFVGEKGWVAVSREGFLTSSEELRRRAKDPGSVRLPVSSGHMKSFADAVLKREQPVATLDSAIRSDLICHIGDIGIRTGEILRWDPNKERILGSSDAVRMMHRPMRAPYDKLLI